VTLRILLVDAPHLGGSATSTRLPGKRQDSRASQYSTQGSGAPCHVSFSFFSPDFSGYSCQDFRWTLSQSPRLNLRLGGYSIWSAILQSHFHIKFGLKTTRVLLKTFKRGTRVRLGTTREDFKTTQGSAGVPFSLGMVEVFLGLLACSTRGRLTTTRQCHQDYSKLSCSTIKYSGLVVWTSLGPLPRWVPGPTTRWAPGTTRLVPHGT
jgi:hypothetical protein